VEQSWRSAAHQEVPHQPKGLQHEGTDEHDPQFDVFQDIQSQNDYSTTQLNVMGYRGDALRAQFCADKVSERQASAPVTVPHTREQQQALAATGTHGKKFFVMGGEHVTLDDMFKAAKINRRTHEAAGKVKEKKSQVEYHARHEAALPIVDHLVNELESNVMRLTSKELEVLLQWKGVPVSKMGNVANRQVLYQQFTEGDAEETSILAPWMEIDQAELNALRNVPNEMSDTAYGRFEEQKKRDAEWAYQKMTPVEKDSFRRKLAEINEAGADDGQTPPSSPTPV
jgi:hypothetical protein